jgi:NAD dependent epimerase/dehydratase family enzyme
LKFRTGVVLTKAGGALPQLAMPIKFGVGSPLGNGQTMDALDTHEQDAIDMYLYRY